MWQLRKGKPITLCLLLLKQRQSRVNFVASSLIKKKKKVYKANTFLKGVDMGIMVAVKVFATSIKKNSRKIDALCSTSAAEQFDNEKRILKRLSLLQHENIVELIDDGPAFLVLEFAEVLSCEPCMQKKNPAPLFPNSFSFYKYNLLIR
jgi:hypothetical protein